MHEITKINLFFTYSPYKWYRGFFIGNFTNVKLCVRGLSYKCSCLFITPLFSLLVSGWEFYTRCSFRSLLFLTSTLYISKLCNLKIIFILINHVLICFSIRCFLGERFLTRVVRLFLRITYLTSIQPNFLFIKLLVNFYLDEWVEQAISFNLRITKTFSF